MVRYFGMREIHVTPNIIGTQVNAFKNGKI